MKLKNLNKKLSKKILILLIVFLILLLCYFLLGVISDILKGSNDPSDYFVYKREDIYYYPPDYNEIITDDIVYLSKNRVLCYSEYGFTMEYDDLSDEMSESAQLFFNYFTTLINGDVNAHKALFSKNYFNTINMPDKFTMQKIYDMHVTLDDRIYDEKDGSYKEFFKVEYKIMENNGTYRADLPSDQNIPTEFEVIRTGNSALINSASVIMIGSK